MKLWLLVRHDANQGNYDEAEGFVIAAETEERARQIADENGGDEKEHLYELVNGTWVKKITKPFWAHAKNATCIELTVPSSEGLILRDFSHA